MKLNSWHTKGQLASQAVRHQVCAAVVFRLPPELSVCCHIHGRIAIRAAWFCQPSSACAASPTLQRRWGLLT